MSSRVACAALLLALAACRPSAAPMAVGDPPAGDGSGQPHLASGPDGSAVLSWLEPDGGGTALRYAVLTDGQWGRPVTVATGASWFVNWADFPSVVPVSDTLWAAHWLEKRAGGTYSYDIALALSRDAGRTWDTRLTPHTDGTATEHGFVTLYRAGDDVGALWLDGREMTADGTHGGHGGGAMTLRSTRVAADGALSGGAVVDDRVCDCCQTDVAIAVSGPVAAYRDRTEGEIRDIYVARHVDGAWQAGSAVASDGWEIAGCPVNGPAIAAAGERVAVAWYTAADDVARVRVAVSIDGGVTFAPAVDIDAEAPVGRVDIELLDDGAAVVSWIAGGAGGLGVVRARVLRPNGSLSASHEIAGSSAARSAGFPQMLRHGDGLLFAWTDGSVDPKRVRATWVAADSLR